MRKIILLQLLIMTVPLIFATHKVYLIHGYAGSAVEMERLHKAIQKEGYICEIYTYPSMVDDIDTVSVHLYNKIRQENFDSVSFVTHSMGALVVRSLYNYLRNDSVFPGIYRIVMIAPPNRGTPLADFWSQFRVVKFFGGPNIENLTTNPETGAARYPVPECEIGIIAGAKGTKNGYNFLIEGDNDGIVPTERTDLEAKKDITYVKASHWGLTFKKEVSKLTLNFLKNGTFD